MSNKITIDLAQEALNAYKEFGSYAKAAAFMGVDPSTVSRRVRKAEDLGLEPMGLEDTTDPEEDRKKKHLKAYIDFIKKERRPPNAADFDPESGITKSSIKTLFGNITKFHDYAEKMIGDDIHKYVLTERFLFTKKRMDDLVGASSKHKRFVITTVVSNKNVHDGFYASLKLYCEKNDAMLVLMICQDAACRKKGYEWSLDPKIADQHIVTRDVKLNDNFSISSIKLSAKHINPLTGLNRLGQRNGSFVYASPKQFLTFVATSPNHSRTPHALMTPGAITVSDYETDYYMSQRTSRIAEEDHVYGAIVVEIEDDKKFHFRQIQADPDDGSFIDLCTKYNSDGTTEDATATLVLGDYHSGATDDRVKGGISDVCRNLPINDLVLHDFFDGFTINHHDRNKPGIEAWKAELGWISLKEELKLGAKELNWLHTLVPGDLIMVKSNHDEFLDRYLNDGAYMNDRVNYYISLDLAKIAVDGDDVLKYAYENYTSINEPNRIKWLSRDEEYRVGGVELGAHGDLGANGSKGTLASIENAYGNCVVGHAHSAAIYRGVFRVGTSSKFDLKYNRGPSNWTHTSCLVYDNGSRQLINFIDGRWRI